MTNKLDPTDAEFARYRPKLLEYQAAKASRDFAVSDPLRQELEDAGFLPPDFIKWHSAFELPKHKATRLNARKEKI